MTGLRLKNTEEDLILALHKWQRLQEVWLRYVHGKKVCDLAKKMFQARCYDVKALGYYGEMAPVISSSIPASHGEQLRHFSIGRLRLPWSLFIDDARNVLAYMGVKRGGRYDHGN